MKTQEDSLTILHFREGICGFETVRNFILLQEDETKTIWSLQATDSRYPSFLVVNPFLVDRNYRPVLSDADLRFLGNPEPQDLCFLVITVIRKNLSDSVVNLKSPIVINVRNKTGKQIIMEDSSYSVRSPLFPKAR